MFIRTGTSRRNFIVFSFFLFFSTVLFSGPGTGQTVKNYYYFFLSSTQAPHSCAFSLCGIYSSGKRCIVSRSFGRAPRARVPVETRYYYQWPNKHTLPAAARERLENGIKTACNRTEKSLVGGVTRYAVLAVVRETRFFFFFYVL